MLSAPLLVSNSIIRPNFSQEKKEAAQTSFKVTLEKFDAASKAKVIKEIKQMLPGANLVEVS